MALKTREPTGQPSWPLILVEGGPKFGKSALSFQTSASEHVGRTFVFEIGETSADEYKALGDYEIVEWGSGWAGFRDQLIAATSEPRVHPDKPNVIIIDSLTGLWTDLKAWLDYRVRNSRRGRETLAQDPDADLDIGMTYWNQAKDRWGWMIHTLKGWDGIAIVIAQAEEVTAIDDNGRPIVRNGKTEKTYRIDAEKTTIRSVDAVVRLVDYRQPRLMAVTSLNVSVPDGGLELPNDRAIESLVFDLLKGEGTFHASAPSSTTSIESVEAKHHLVETVLALGAPVETAKRHAGSVWFEAFPKEGPQPLDLPIATFEMLRAAVAESYKDDQTGGDPPAASDSSDGESDTTTAPADTVPSPSDSEGPGGIRQGETVEEVAERLARLREQQQRQADSDADDNNDDDSPSSG